MAGSLVLQDKKDELTPFYPVAPAILPSCYFYLSYFVLKIADSAYCRLLIINYSPCRTIIH